MASSYLDILTKKYNKMILSRDEVARELGCSIKTLERKIHLYHEPIKYLKNGQKLQFPLKAFATYLENLEKFSA